MQKRKTLRITQAKGEIILECNGVLKDNKRILRINISQAIPGRVIAKDISSRTDHLIIGKTKGVDAKLIADRKSVV